MSPSEPHRSRTGPAWTRVLLIAALLFGFVAMHTLGHLQHEAHASTGFPGVQSAEPTPVPHSLPVLSADEASHHPDVGHAPEVGPGSGSGAHSVGWENGATRENGDTWENAAALPELDPTSVCLTLGSFVVVLLGVAAVAFVRWPGIPAKPTGPVLRPPRSPFPTPADPSLARLQVLRV